MTLRWVLSTLLVLSCALAPTAARGQASAAWAVHLDAAKVALADGDINLALVAWHEGHSAALRSRTWRGVLEVGEAYLRIAEAGSFRASAKPLARQIFLYALILARAQRSAEGALRVASAFDGLGDREVVEQCVKIAEDLARRHGDSMALQEVAATRARLALQMKRPRDGTAVSACQDFNASGIGPDRSR